MTRWNRRAKAACVGTLGASLALAGPAAAPAPSSALEKFKVKITCKDRHLPKYRAHTSGVDPGADDFFDFFLSLLGDERVASASASALKPVKGAKVVGRLTDLTTDDGQNNVLDGSDTATSSSKGRAKLTFSFNNFGRYRLSVTVSKRGYRTFRTTRTYVVMDRVSGACEAA